MTATPSQVGESKQADSESEVPRFDDLVPEGVRLAVAGISDCTDRLIGDEARLIERAVDKRRFEFATGRVLARQLLAESGHADYALMREEETRLPRWPREIVGSISHTDDLCVVAIASGRAFAGLGIDVEPDAPTNSEIERVVLREGEFDWVRDAVNEAERSRRCRIVFSVKEAVYKAFYPRTRTFWSFQDVGVSIDLEGGRFEAALPESAGRDRVEGQVRRRAGWIASCVAYE